MGPVVEHPSHDVFPLWAQNGKTILFRSDRADGPGLWSQSIQDGGPLGVPQLLRRGLISRFMPLGLSNEGIFFFCRPVGARELYFASIDAETGLVEDSPQLLGRRNEGVVMLWGTAWSPDGERLAYVSEAGQRGQRVLVIHSLATGEEREYTPELRGFLRPHWAPEGESIFVRGRDANDRRGLFRIDAQTGALETVFLDESFGPFDLAPDGSAVYYWADEGTLFVRSLATGAIEKLYGPDIFQHCVSPDGETLAFVQKGRLLLMPSSGGEPLEILSLDDEGLGLREWTADGSALFLKSNDGNGKSSLWLLSVAGGPPRPLGLSMERGLHNFIPHPDGRRLSFTAGDAGMEVWGMENFLGSVEESLVASE